MRIVMHHGRAVPAAFLGGVEALVGDAEDLGKAAGTVEGNAADADRQRPLPAVRGKGRQVDGPADAFGNGLGGALVVNMGTHSPAWSQALGADIAAAGGRFVEAPVSGSRGPAETGDLVVMAAGERDAVEAARPLLAPLCREIVVTGS